MKIHNQILFIIILTTLCSRLVSQSNIIDSLKLAFKNAKHDTSRCIILNEIIEAELDDNVWPIYNEQLKSFAESKLKLTSNLKLKTFYLKQIANTLNNTGFLAQQQGEMNKALDYYLRGLKIQEETNDRKGMALSLNNIGIIYQNRGDISKALNYYHKSLTIYEDLNNKNEISLPLNNIGLIYSDLGEISKALDYYHKSLKVQEEIMDAHGIGRSLSNIAYIYNKQGDGAKALEYLERGLAIQIKNNDKIGIGRSLSYIGFIYKEQGLLKKSLENHLASLKIREEQKDKQGVAECLNNIGINYDDAGNTDLALYYYHKSLETYKEIENKDAVASSLKNIAEALLQKGLTHEAYQYAFQSFQLSKELGFPENIKRAAQILKKIYKKQNNYKEALVMYELEVLMRDSINNAETKKASTKKQFQYQYEKKAAADSVKNAEEQKVKNAQLTVQQSQLKQEKTQRLVLYGGLALVIIFLGFVFNRFKITQKQKVIIEQQKVLVDNAFNHLEEKNKEVIDSIYYARRIQRALLTPEITINKDLSRLSGKNDSKSSS